MAGKIAIHELEIDGKKCQLAKIDRATLEIALGLIMADKPEYIKAGEIIVRSCWVSGDKEILDDEDLLVGAALAAQELISVKKASLKKL